MVLRRPVELAAFTRHWAVVDRLTSTLAISRTHSSVLGHGFQGSRRGFVSAWDRRPGRLEVSHGEERAWADSAAGVRRDAPPGGFRGSGRRVFSCPWAEAGSSWLVG